MRRLGSRTAPAERAATHAARLQLSSDEYAHATPADGSRGGYNLSPRGGREPAGSPGRG